MKKKVLKSLIALLLIAVLMTTLVGCLKIGLKKNNVIERLTEQGYTIVYGRPPLSINEELMRTVSLDESFSASKTASDGRMQFVYAYYCLDTDSADRLEDLINDSKITNDAGEEISLIDSFTQSAGRNCIIYRNEEIIFFGDFETISTARNY